MTVDDDVGSIPRSRGEAVRGEAGEVRRGEVLRERGGGACERGWATGRDARDRRKPRAETRGRRGGDARLTTRARDVMLEQTQDTLDKVRGIISEQLGTDIDSVAADAKFVDLGADSLDTVEIMMALEEQFEITLDEEGAEKIATVQEAADMIQAQI